MTSLKSKAATTALATLLITLPADEGVLYKPYYDIAGVLTVCYGHTGSDIVKNKKYTEQECLTLLQNDVKRHMKVVESCSKREIPHHPLVGFTSFDFNTGSWCKSRSNREWNLGNDEEACRALAYSPSGAPSWSYINGNTFVDGLHKRRIREMIECLKNTSSTQ